MYLKDRFLKPLARVRPVFRPTVLATCADHGVTDPCETRARSHCPRRSQLCSGPLAGARDLCAPRAFCGPSATLSPWSALLPAPARTRTSTLILHTPHSGEVGTPCPPSTTVCHSQICMCPALFGPGCLCRSLPPRSAWSGPHGLRLWSSAPALVLVCIGPGLLPQWEKWSSERH